ncbi:HTH-type transcriptional activator RhaR [Paenibacillus solanacearum]|uniref:HTH-type transcriptional activator RhaR n=1 Tax=Paenibacillus solanacearum TaxID=2048548 RepID=A0A916NL53_9BACL|nr:AraC family transcriptional regulator [Paenibacillus solanacearum]CAG7646384.1 HTH-type transcriptional activator RhaR [Paenibacillus solanacearum]
MDMLNIQTICLRSHLYCERIGKFKYSSQQTPFWVMFGVEAGEFRYTIGNETGIATAGDLIYCAPQHQFYRELLTLSVVLHYVLFTFVDEDEVPPLPTYKICPTDERRLQSNFAYLRKLHYVNDTYGIARKQWIVNDIWQLACDEWLLGTSRFTEGELFDSEDELMNRAAAWLTQKALTPFSMKEISTQLHLSPSQFTLRFRRAFRKTPSELVRSLRIRKAASLLLETEWTLDEIAKRCGYDNGFYLSRVFTESMHMSPSAYRQQHRV